MTNEETRLDFIEKHALSALCHYAHAYDPPTCSWKIYPCLFNGDLATFSETWPRFGMMRHGVSYRLPTREPCTCASGSGLPQDAWPTPTVHGNNNFKGSSAKSGDGLTTVIKRREGMFPTPQARDCHSGTAHPHGWAKSGAGAQHNLNDYVLKWPTPCATDYKEPSKTPRDRLDYAVNGETKSARFDTPTVHGDGGSGRKGTMPKFGQLNPDWEEWLMAWPIGWTDIETPNIRLVWLDPSIDPADYGEIPRVTNRRDNRPARVKEIGNGQFPLTAAAAFHWGLCVLQLVNKRDGND